MKIPLYSLVSLLVDFPKYHLKAGDVATVIEYLDGDNTIPEGYICETANALGETIAVFSVHIDQITPLNRNEVFHVREIAVA